jgi:hypothetical protein
MVDLAVFRNKKSESLVHLLTRPGMYSPGLQAAGQAIMDDLLTLDEVVWPDWVSPFLYRFGKLGINGALVATFGESRYHGEVASILAEMAYRMNLFQPQGPLLKEDDVSFSEHLRELWWDRDVTFDRALEQLPEPTMVIDNRVVSFAPTSGGWIHLDFDCERICRYDRSVGNEVYEQGELLLRNLRLPTEKFDEGIVLTLFGRYRRFWSCFLDRSATEARRRCG